MKTCTKDVRMSTIMSFYHVITGLITTKSAYKNTITFTSPNTTITIKTMTMTMTTTSTTTITSTTAGSVISSEGVRTAEAATTFNDIYPTTIGAAIATEKLTTIGVITTNEEQLTTRAARTSKELTIQLQKQLQLLRS